MVLHQVGKDTLGTAFSPVTPSMNSFQAHWMLWSFTRWTKIRWPLYSQPEQFPGRLNAVVLHHVGKICWEQPLTLSLPAWTVLWQTEHFLACNKPTFTAVHFHANPPTYWWKKKLKGFTILHFIPQQVVHMHTQQWKVFKDPGPVRAACGHVTVNYFIKIQAARD